MKEEDKKEVFMYLIDKGIALLIMGTSLYLSFYVVLPHTQRMIFTLIAFVIIVIMLMFIKDNTIKDIFTWASGDK